MHLSKRSIRFNSFTILEVLIVISITTIVVFLSLSIYSSFFKLYYKYAINFKETNSLLIFNDVITNDLETTNFIELDTNELILLQKNKQIVCYEFSDDNKIIRKDKDIIDTFSFTYDSIKYDILSNYELFLLSFKIKLNNQSIDFIAAKEFDLSTLMNKNIINGD